jgi:hypothetical protein
MFSIKNEDLALLFSDGSSLKSTSETQASTFCIEPPTNPSSISLRYSRSASKARVTWSGDCKTSSSKNS